MSRSDAANKASLNFRQRGNARRGLTQAIPPACVTNVAASLPNLIAQRGEASCEQA
jgi:hypothetical protein